MHCRFSKRVASEKGPVKWSKSGQRAGPLEKAAMHRRTPNERRSRDLRLRRNRRVRHSDCRASPFRACAGRIRREPSVPDIRSKEAAESRSAAGLTCSGSQATAIGCRATDWRSCCRRHRRWLIWSAAMDCRFSKRVASEKGPVNWSKSGQRAGPLEKAAMHRRTPNERRSRDSSPSEPASSTLDCRASPFRACAGRIRREPSVPGIRSKEAAESRSAAGLTCSGSQATAIGCRATDWRMLSKASPLADRSAAMHCRFLKRASRLKKAP